MSKLKRRTVSKTDNRGVPASHGATFEMHRADQESVLLEAQRLIFGDRRQEYGHPLDDYTRTAGMVNACFAHILKRPFTAEEVMTVMILVKVSRYQETQKRDTLVDMAGYCGTIGEAQAERLRRAQQAQGTQRGSEQRATKRSRI